MSTNAESLPAESSVRSNLPTLSIEAFIVEKLLDAAAAGCRECLPTFDLAALAQHVAALEAERGQPFPRRN